MEKKNKPPAGELCLLMDRLSIPAARGLLQSPPDAPNIQVRVLDGRIEEVLAHEILQVLLEDGKTPPRLSRIILRRGDMLVLEPLRTLGEEVRQNLRMPVDFKSFIYPDGGGQVPIRGNDLSCGGISFYSSHDFAEGEEFEIAIPITAEGPLLLRGHILRRRDSRGGNDLYAAKFVDMINDQERRVRQAVFSVQLKGKA